MEMFFLLVVVGIAAAAYAMAKTVKESKVKFDLTRSRAKEIFDGKKQPTLNELNELLDKFIEFKNAKMFWKEEDNMYVDSLRNLRDKLLLDK